MYDRSPIRLLEDVFPSWRAMLMMFNQWHGGASVGHLPEAGGAGDQAAIMMDAFHIMASAKARMPKGS